MGLPLRGRRWLLGLLLASGLGVLYPAQAQTVVARYGPATTPHLSTLQDRLREARLIEEMAQTLSSGLWLPTQLTLATAECGSNNAYYSRTHKAIVLCLDLLHHFATEIPKAFTRAPSKADVNAAVSGAITFVLLHELGHALIDILNVPLLGREEDAADQIGVFIMLQGQAPPQELAGAIWFFRQTTLFYGQRHFSGEHSLGPQRQSNIVCWAYGADPERYASLLRTGLVTRDRAARCPREYSQLDAAVRQLLGDAISAPPLERR